MKKTLIASLLLVSAVSAQAVDWDVKPKLYVRGGFSQSLDLNAKGNEDVSKFNPGSWGGESSAFMNNLTEADMVANYKDLATIVYGVNFDQTTRFEKDNASNETFKERQAYIEMHKIFGENGTIWFGRRPYRGFGDYLTGSFPLDERNMFGGGIKIKAGPGQYEFAYGTNDDDDVDSTDNITDNFTTNFYLNKYILPITNGNITINAELHQNNSRNSDYDSMAYQIGAQYARWNMKLLDANWYNIFVVNYSNGHLGDIEAGLMQSVFDSKKNDEKASKLLVKIGGDLKAKMWSMFYALRYQWHMGDLNGVDGSQDWQFVDIHARPMYALTSNVGLGLDYVQRVVINETDALDNAGKSWAKQQNMWRAGLIANYHLSPGGEKLFENAEISVIAGRVHQQKETDFFQGRESKKDANFIRFKYTMEI